MGLNIQNVTFKYAKKAPKNTINNINLTINDKDEFIAILGHNGSGKSTTAKLINMVLTPNRGRIFVEGTEITNENITDKDIFEDIKRIALQ